MAAALATMDLVSLREDTGCNARGRMSVILFVWQSASSAWMTTGRCQQNNRSATVRMPVSGEELRVLAEEQAALRRVGGRAAADGRLGPDRRDRPARTALRRP